MVQLFWDASSLLKRYYAEVGSETVDALFTDALVTKQTATVLGYAETFSILLRRRNSGSLTATTFNLAATALEEEILFGAEFDLLALGSDLILKGIPLMRQHNINSSDAAILAAFLRYSRAQTSDRPTCILVAADQRFLRAASAEGLATLNPESVSAAAVPAILAAL